MSKIVFKKYGSGSTALIAFPGWIHPIENENKFLKLLSQKYIVYSIHLPGYLDNKNSESFYNFSHYCNEIHRELKKINGEQVLVGFSMGCRLIMELEKLYPNDFKKIFVGSPVSSYKISLWAKVLLLNSSIFSLLRKSKTFKNLVVNKALKTITNDRKAVFNGENVTLTGAFDSLIGLIKSESYFEEYIYSTSFIYGKKDHYLQEAKNFNIKNLKVIKNAGHNCVRDNEVKVMGIIDSFIKN
ncbi:alpha/beta hydrolase [Patescibacteria group bacterium]|nr:alpha/beta hydrolase [Patescibacteria group bacterium]